MLQQSAAQSPACPADVYAVEPLGDENIVDLRIGAAHGETLLQGGDAAALRAHTAPALRPRVGDKVWITPVARDVHVFDPHTEEAIR
jgi:ABC-type sugar transport system ATPase subunit